MRVADGVDNTHGEESSLGYLRAGIAGTDLLSRCGSALSQPLQPCAPLGVDMLRNQDHVETRANDWFHQPHLKRLHVMMCRGENFGENIFSPCLSVRSPFFKRVSEEF
jgi:hypothetical protein